MTPALTISPPLPEEYRLYQLAENIRAEASRTIHGIVAIGRCLIEAQALLKSEGRWVEWLQTEFAWSTAQAYNFINTVSLTEKHPELLRGEYPVSGLYLLAGSSDDVVQKVLDEGPQLKGKALRMIRLLRWECAVEKLIETDPGAALQEVERKIDDPYYHERAVDVFKKHEAVFEELSGEDAPTVEISAGLTLEERYPEDVKGLPPSCQLVENCDGCHIDVWVEGNPHTICVFPRRLPPVAMAARNAALLAVTQRLKVKAWEEQL